MASFDLETYLRVQGTTGASTFESIGMSFGIPSCIIGLGQGALSLIPSNLLGSMSTDIEAAKSKAQSVVSDVFKKITKKTGILEFDTETGTFKFTSDTSWMGMDSDDNSLLDDINALVGLAEVAAAGATQVYQNLAAGASQLAAILDCFSKLGTVKEYSSGKSADQRRTLPQAEREEIFNREYGAAKASLDYAREFIAQAEEQQKKIGEIIRAREANPDLEPCFLDSRSLDNIISGTSLKRCSADDPGMVEDDEEVFRLTYGPPVTTRGQYVLTEDGLYYDSRSGGLDPVFLAISGIVPIGDRWRYEYDPNLGGKGDSISIDSLNNFKDNIFDPNLIDDSVGIKKYYDQDHFLAVLKQQRDKYVYDLSSDLSEYIAQYGPTNSVVLNQRQLIISEIANHTNKINRRKKQIEIAIKGPQIYGGLSGPAFAPGEVPINDFSYLEEYNLLVDLEKQRALIFEQAEVEGIVLPITPKFIASPKSRAPSLTFEHLHVPNVGKGSIIYTPSGSPSGTVLSLTDQIVAKDLFSIYNFLTTDLVLPSSMEYKVTNCATENRYNDAQLVGIRKNEVFASGLAIPYMEGVTKKSSSDSAYASAVGSYVRLPDTEEFREMAYSPSGFTMECWVHVPNITDGAEGWLSGAGAPAASSLTKVLLACENTGVKDGVSAVDETGQLVDLDYLRNDRGDAFTRGLVCGFTRDRRITQENLGFSNDNNQNDPVSSLSFFIAPTQARDASSASWINKDDCQSSATFYKMKVDLSATDFGKVDNEFVLVDVTCDPQNNEIKFFADGSLVATSALSEVFGVAPSNPASLPTFKKDNSFEYSYTSVDGVKQLKEGPKLNDFYTPWLVGGGYTDGLFTGGFLGGDRGGLISGLRGNIGSLKFYSRPLNNDEVETNYKAQEGFFKNIQV